MRRELLFPKGGHARTMDSAACRAALAGHDAKGANINTRNNAGGRPCTLAAAMGRGSSRNFSLPRARTSTPRTMTGRQPCTGGLSWAREVVELLIARARHEREDDAGTDAPALGGWFRRLPSGSIAKGVDIEGQTWWADAPALCGGNWAKGGRRSLLVARRVRISTPGTSTGRTPLHIAARP